MKKNVILLILLAAIVTSIAAVPMRRAAATVPAPPVGPGLLAAAAQDAARLLPASTSVVYIVDIKKLLSNEFVAKALQEPKIQAGLDDYLKSTGIDPRKDFLYAGFGMPFPADPSQFMRPAAGTTIKNFGMIVKLKYDRARFLKFLKDRNPDARVGSYKGVTTVSLGLGGTSPNGAPLFTGGGIAFGVIALLDRTHQVFGDAKGVEGIIDVYKKKASPLAKNTELAALVGRIDKKSLVGSAMIFPADYLKKLTGPNPMATGFGEIKGMTLAVDDANSMIVADLRIFGGTKGQNTTRASTLNGLKVVMGGAYASKDPVVAELLKGISVSSGDDHTRLDVTLSHETAGKLWKLVGPKGPSSAPGLQGAGAGWKALNDEATDLHRRGNIERAIEVEKKALELAEKLAGPDHLDVALSLNNLAVFYDAAGRYAEAEPLFGRAQAIREKVLGPDHLEVALILYNYGRHYESQKLHAQSEPLFSRALAIREKALGPDHPDVAVMLDEIAYVRHYQGRDADAEPLFKRALAIRERSFGPGHVAAGRSCDNLGNLYFLQARFADAEPFYRRSLKIFEKALGPNHPDVARTLSALGTICLAQGRPGEAETLYTRALSAMDKALGPGHPDESGPLIGLASIYLDKQKYEKAEPLLQRALEVTEKSMGPNDPRVAQVLDVLSRLYRETKRAKQAQECEDRAARIRAIKR